MFSDVKQAKRLTQLGLSPYSHFLVGRWANYRRYCNDHLSGAIGPALHGTQIFRSPFPIPSVWEIFWSYCLLKRFFLCLYYPSPLFHVVKLFGKHPLLPRILQKRQLEEELFKGFGLEFFSSVVMLILILTGSYQLVGATFTPYAFGFVLLTLLYFG